MLEKPHVRVTYNEKPDLASQRQDTRGVVVAPDSVLAGSIEGSLGRSAPRATLPAWLSYA